MRLIQDPIDRIEHWLPRLHPAVRTGPSPFNCFVESSSPDGLVYSWTIAADANWSDGTPIVADD